MNITRTFSRSPSLVITVAAAASLMVAACGAPPTEVDHDEEALVAPQWIFVDTCATSIAVAADDTIWVVGCDNRADGDIWYMRDVCEGLACGPSWIKTAGRASRVAVDPQGNAIAVSSSGWPTKELFSNVNHIATPTGAWSHENFPSDCVSGLAQRNPGSFALGFVTPVETYDLSKRQRYGTACSVDQNGNSPILMANGALGATWSSIGFSARKIVMFENFSLGGQPWALLADGSLATSERVDGTGFQSRAAPPSFTYDLTDRYAATNAGIYQWDPTPGWQRILDNTTPTGTIVQIAHAGAMQARLANGTFATFGPSSLWGIDDSGAIYRAQVVGSPR